MMQRFALIWLGLIFTLACWAPLLANSAPLLAVRKSDDAWLAPAFALLTAEDLAWITAWCVGVGWVRRTKRITLKRVASGALLVAAVALAASWLMTPSQLIQYDRWRRAEAAGEIQVVISAPIPYSPRDYLRDIGYTAFEPPLASAPQRWHWLGTDEQGADVASRLIHASRTALAIGLVATGIALAIGVVIGALMGYWAGWVDLIGMRLVEIIEAIPTLFLLLAFVAFFDRSLVLMMAIIGLTAWPGYARYARAEFLRLRRIEFVLALEALGVPLYRILWGHMLPNAVAPLAVAAAFGIASAILAESTLSFLGLGPVDEPSWGQMLNQAVKSASFHWWLALFPGGAILLTVFAYNLLGEALRDQLDPEVQKSAFRG